MPVLPAFLTNPHRRRWTLQVLGILLVFGLLALGVWLYYSDKIRALEQRLTNPPAVRHTP